MDIQVNNNNINNKKLIYSYRLEDMGLAACILFHHNPTFKEFGFSSVFVR